MRYCFKGLKHYFANRLKEYKLACFQIEWENVNKHNQTVAGTIFPKERVSVGNYSYGTLNIHSYGSSNERLSIGHCVSIAGNTHFILSGEHKIDGISTFPFAERLCGEECICKGPINIEDDVWIGFGALILSGVTIGQGSVVAAGSVVVNDIPPYSIAVGIPAKVIKRRAGEEYLELLSKIDYSKVKEDFVRQRINIFKEKLDAIDDIRSIVNQVL